MCWNIWAAQQNFNFFVPYPEMYLNQYSVFVLPRLTSTNKLSLLVLNLLQHVVNTTACSLWKKAQIYALQSIRFLDVIHRFLLSHLGRSVQLSQIQRQILQIHMVLVVNLLQDLVNETACSWWMKAQIYRVKLFLIPDSNHDFLLSHYESCLQISKFCEQIHVIHIVSAIGWSVVNWQSGHPWLHPCILEISPPILQTVVTMLESKTFNNY